MDKGDLTSGSDMRKNLKLDDDDSMNDVEDDIEENDFEDDEEMSDDDAEKEKVGRNAMAKLFIAEPNINKNGAFAKFMGLVAPNIPFSVPLIEKEVLEIHEEYKEKAKKFLKDFEGSLTLSYEWMLLGNSLYDIRGPILHDNFVCITAHFIDDNWKVRNWILGYTTDQSIPLDDIYPYHFRSIVQGFEIENKVSTILMPNHEEFDEKTVAAIRKCVEEKGNYSINPPVFQIYCCADLFRLMFEDVYSELSGKLLEDLRMLVGWGRCSSPNWNVWLFQLQEAVDLQYENAFSKDEIYDDYDKPSDEEWIKIETFCKLIGYIYKVAKELFEQGYSTSNVYFHLLAELKVMLNQALASADNDYSLRKAKGILKRFDKYWNDMFLVLATASVLDPRFKLKYLEFYCSKEKDNAEGSKAETVLDYLCNLYARYAARDICQKPICPVATIDAEEEDDDEEDVEEEDDDEEDVDEEEDYDEEEEEEKKEKEEKKPDAYEKFVMFQEFLKFEEFPRELQGTELDSYLKEPVMEWNKDFKALEWWKEESQKYPVLSRVARDILSIPISRATSYDAYFPDKREPPEFVVSMEPKLANAMMCCKSWLEVFGY